MALSQTIWYRRAMSRLSVSYILCSNPRSGTTLLCDMLRQTGVAGKPDSFFRQKSLLEWCASWRVAGPINPKDLEFTRRYFNAMRKEGRGGTNVFGLRLMGPDLEDAQMWLRRLYPGQHSDHARFTAAFGPLRYIHLSRHDKLAEAVSYTRAEQTGLWHSKPDGSDLERIAPTASEGYDAAALTARMNALIEFDAAWSCWFEAEGIRPLRISYEALADDPQAVLGEVLNHIGQNPNLSAQIQPGVRKLADETSAAWIARYRAEHPNA